MKKAFLHSAQANWDSKYARTIDGQKYHMPTLVTRNDLENTAPVSAQFNASDLEAIQRFQTLYPDAEIVAVGEEEDYQIMSLTTLLDKKFPHLKQPTHTIKVSRYPIALECLDVHLRTLECTKRGEKVIIEYRDDAPPKPHYS